ncbi:MAG: family 1 glycosylhydrolase [Merdibacter sp.]
MERKRRYGDIPIYVTKTATAVTTSRMKTAMLKMTSGLSSSAIIFIILKAKQDVKKGYYVWSTMDLYSWINVQKRYGLVRGTMTIRSASARRKLFLVKQFIAEHQDL